MVYLVENPEDGISRDEAQKIDFLYDKMGL